MYVGFLVAFCLTMLELAYKTQLIDFYRPELTSYNPDALASPPNGNMTILVFGDSFSAGLGDTYVARLREKLSEFRVINSGVGGSGSVQAHLIAPRRFQSFKPAVVVYQIYVGNELFDIRYSSNLDATGIMRWAYWNVANHFRFVSWLNYRLGQIWAAKERSRVANDGLLSEVSKSEIRAMRQDPHKAFSPELYTERQKIMISAEPDLVDNTLNLLASRRKDFQRLVSSLREIMQLCNPNNCRAYVMVVPHKMQVSRRYLAEYQQLGALVRKADAVMNLDYPFIAELQRRVTDLDHVKVLNPLPDIQRKEAEGVHLYFFNDEHMNQNGQMLLFNTIVNQLKSDHVIF